MPSPSSSPVATSNHHRRRSTLQTNSKAKELIERYVATYKKGIDDPLKPFIGAKPKFLTEPKIASNEESEMATRLASATITQLIVDYAAAAAASTKTSSSSSGGVLLVMGQDASYSPSCRKVLNTAKDDATSVNTLPVTVCMNIDWCHTIPHITNTTGPGMGVPAIHNRLLIFVGTPSKYLAMITKFKLEEDVNLAYEQNRLVVVTRGAIMLPLGSQEQNLLGTDADHVLDAIVDTMDEVALGGCAWGHGIGTKSELLSHAFYHLPRTMHWMHVPREVGLPAPMVDLEQAIVQHSDGRDEYTEFDSFVDYIKYSNELKLAMPMMCITNYYDAGLLVSIVQGFVQESGAGMLTDRDGLAMLREGSIGHTMSKMNQVCSVEPWASTRSLYNFYIGDGAARLNNGMETAFHLMENYTGSNYVTVFVFNNHRWAIEDNLVADIVDEHVLNNTDFYNVIAGHPNVTITTDMHGLHTKLKTITEDQNLYAKGETSAKFQIVIVRGLELEVPVLLGDMDSIKGSNEMDLMRKILGEYATGCEGKVPLYGCSAFEYIQYLKTFMQEMPEGKLYQYTCGRTDIQAAHMCGYDQPEGRCVLFINDVYGINSLGESLRMIQSGLGRDSKQVLIFIWHPSLLGVIDHFHVHRPAMVWPSVGTNLAKYYVRKESDGFFVDFHGTDVDKCVTQVSKAIHAKTPLIVINMLPEHEQNYVSLDIRAKIPPAN